MFVVANILKLLSVFVIAIASVLAFIGGLVSGTPAIVGVVAAVYAYKMDYGIMFSAIYFIVSAAIVYVVTLLLGALVAGLFGVAGVLGESADAITAASDR